MPESFGARLRQRREEQGISLLAIAEQTKIKLSLLDGLERDDVSHWPSGIYRRAFIRAYAHAIGLNPDGVVREFFEVYPEPTDVAATDAVLAPGADSALMMGAPPTRLQYLVGSAIGSLSRLRRAAAPGSPGVTEGATVSPPALSTSDLPRAARLSPEPGPTDAMSPMVADAGPLNERASPEPEPGPMAVAHPYTDAHVDRTNAVDAGPVPLKEAPLPGPDLLAAAHLCTQFGRVETTDEVQPLLFEAARILDATGLIVWLWDGPAAALKPALAHGFSDRVLAQLPTVKRDADNATADAFRSAETCVIRGSDRASGALVVPLLTPAGCAGVLAIELQHGSEQTTSARAVATIFAAQLAQLVGGAEAGQVQPILRAV
jgi:transcriptional regulator with XRE-family HTH domain